MSAPSISSMPCLAGLPLSDGAAEALLVGLADLYGDRSREILARVVRFDPPLAIACHRWADAQRVRLTTAEGAADFLIAQGPAALAESNRSEWAQPASPATSPDPYSAVERDRLARSAAMDVRIAALASQVAAQRGLPADEAWFAALVSRAPFWLSPAEHGDPVTDSTCDARIAVAIADAERLASRSFADGGVTRPDFAAADAAAGQAALHWTAPSSSVARALPALLRRLGAAGRCENGSTRHSGEVDDLRRGGEADFTKRLAEEKLAALAEFAAGAGHELNNPLANIAGRAQLLARSEADPKRRRDLAVIHAQAMRAHDMIAGLMLFARPPAPRLAPYDPAQLLRQTISRFAPLAEARGVELSAAQPSSDSPPSNASRPAFSPPGPILADTTQLQVALAALVDNALSAAPPGGHVLLSWVEDESSGMRGLRVDDDGSGIPPEILRHAFDPFFSGRPAGRGLGVGLCKAARIAELHGGRLELESPPPGGARATLWLPLPASSHAKT